MNTKIHLKAVEYFEYSRSLRRDLHRHPELGYQEVRTAGIVTSELTRLGMEVTSGIAETGVVGLLEGSQPGPVVLVRFDMDALPVTETTEVDYRSVVPGVMHACGHDGHVAVGLTVARILSEIQDSFRGTVKFVFQPAEEGLGGAEKMVEAGVLDDPVPDACLAMHIWNERPVGWAAIVPGALMAGAEVFRLKVIGKGGHGAMPDQIIDPILATAHVITAIQSVISRNISPVDGGVISFTTIHAGEAFNVIPPSVECTGTIRWFENDTRERIIRRFREIVTGVAEGMGCQLEVDIRTITPAVQNDPRLAEQLRLMAEKEFPQIHLETNYRSMVSEDMAFLLEKIPGVYLLVGGANANRGLNYSHHHPNFNFDEDVLPTAVSLMASAIVRLLEGDGD